MKGCPLFGRSPLFGVSAKRELIVLVITYPLQDRHTFLALLQTSPNLMSQYSVMEDEVLELRERGGGGGW